VSDVPAAADLPPRRGGPRVVIGMPVGSGSIPWPTAVSLMSTIRVLDREKIPVRIEAPMGSSIVQWARSAVAESFLKSDFTHLFWIDSDIVWSPNDFVRLLGFGAALDVVCATYPLKKEPEGYLVNLLRDENGNLTVNGLGCIKIASLGLGFTLVKRAVIEKLSAASPRVRDSLNKFEYADIFRVDTHNGGPRGEDVAFFADVRELGYDVWLDPSINLGHVGPKIYRGNVIDALGLSQFASQEK